MPNSTFSALEKTLKEGMKQLSVPETPIEPFMDYLTLLIKWNKVYNLTAIRDPEAILIKHFLDSLSIHSHLKPTRCLDVGTGAGFPGIPLAIAYPNRSFTLIDSQRKKIDFLQAVKRTLALEDVTIVHARIGDFIPDVLFDCIVTRAFCDLNHFMPLTKRLLQAQGIALMMKGDLSREEGLIKAENIDIIPIKVPLLEANRCLMVINRLN